MDYPTELPEVTTMDTTQTESGVTRCPCCGDEFMTSDIHAGVPCGDCRAADCEATRDGSGQLGYWNCQREDVSDDPANYQDGPCGDR